jgi:hypothetical protein
MKFSLLAGISAGALLITSASAALAGSPAPTPEASVPSISDGFVSLAIGGDQLTESFFGESTSIDGLTIEGAASGSYMFSSTLGFQGDVVLSNQTYSGNDFIGEGNLTERNADVALHGFYRNDQYLIGAFAQYGMSGVSSDEAPGVSFDRYYAGAEGQLFLNNATLYAQLGGQQFRLGSELESENVNGWFGTFEARYFLQPDFKIDAHVGFDTFNVNLGEETTLTTWHAGVGAEYRFSGTPFSVFAKYDYSQETANGESGSISDNRILVGAKFNFDTPTLLDRDRSGASLKPVDNNLGIFGL